MRLLFISLLAISAWANTCTTTAVGTNASNVMHWTGCGGTTPQPGDIVIISNTTTQDLDLDIGNSPDGSLVDNTMSALQANAAYTVASGVTLRVRGHVHQGNAAVLFQAGSHLIFDATSAASPITSIYLWYADSFSAGSRSLTFAGVSGNRATVTSQTGGAAGRFVNKSGFTDGININAAFTNFSNIGDATHDAITLTNSSPNTWVQTFNRCQFDGTGLFKIATVNQSTGGGYLITNNTWKNSVSTTTDGNGHALAVSIGGTLATITGTHTFTGNVVDKYVLNTVTSVTVEDNIFLSNQYWSGSTDSTLVSFKRNLLRFPDKTTARNEAGDTIDNYYVHTVPETARVWTGTLSSFTNSGAQMVLTVSGPAMTATSMVSNATNNWDLHVESGAGVDLVRSVRTNGTNTITVDGRWPSGRVPVAGDTISVYFGVGGNIHWFVSNTYLTSWLVDGVIIDQQNADNNGDWAAKPTTPAPPNSRCLTIVRNSIMLPNAQRSNSSPIFVTLGTNYGVGYPDYAVSAYRNTIFAGAQSCAHVGEQGTGHADQWHEFRDNLCYTDPGVDQIAVGGSTTPVNNFSLVMGDWVSGGYTPADYSVTNGAAHHNAKWGLAAGTAGGGYTLHPTSPTTPWGQNDVTADPQLVDDTRNIFTWGKSLGLTGTRVQVIDKVLAELAKKNDDTGFDSRFTVANLIAYVRAGFKPQNSALMASSTGGWIGAVDGDTAPPPSSTAKASMSGKFVVTGKSVIQ